MVEFGSQSPGPTTHWVRLFSRLGWFVLTLSLTVFHSYLLPSFILSFLPPLPPLFLSSLSLHLPLPFFLLLHRLRTPDWNSQPTQIVASSVPSVFPYPAVCPVSAAESPLLAIIHHSNLDNICDGSHLLFILQDLESSSKQASGHVCQFLLLGY